MKTVYCKKADMSLSKPEKSQNKNLLALVLGWSDCWAANPPLTRRSLLLLLARIHY